MASAKSDLRGAKDERYKPIPAFSSKQIASFWSKVEKRPGGCWFWTGKLSPSGYGYFCEYRVHRLSFAMVRGAVPSDKSLDHICRNRTCVNPDHLEIVTNKVNILRGLSPTALNARRTHCKNGHEFNSTNTRITGNGRRLCRICRQAYVKAHGYFR